MFSPRNILKNGVFFVPQYFNPMVFLSYRSNLFPILLILHTTEFTGKSSRENLVSVYIFHKFFVPRVQNTKISKFPPKTFKIPNFAKCKKNKKLSLTIILKFTKFFYLYVYESLITMRGNLVKF